MAKLSAGQIFTAARSAGLSVAAATLATAIALAESGGDDAAVGDTGLQTAVWGPSVGLWQIRTLKSETNTGSDRDINALRGNVARQALAMLHISGGGTNWTPWSVYNTGAYKKFTSAASAAASSGGAALPGAVPTGLPGITGDDGFLDRAVTALRNTGLKLTGVTLGLVLVGVGLTVAVVPAMRQRAVQAAKVVTG